MAPGPVTATDRRHRRRQETIEEILDIAEQIMAEQGVAGLSVGEIARRMGIRPPSVYVYFPSKRALYDALFARGARLLLAAMQEVTAALPARPATLEEILLPGARAFVRWSVEHAAYSQLLFWRPVPGFTPSPQAYQAAIELIERGRDRLSRTQACSAPRCPSSRSNATGPSCCPASSASSFPTRPSRPSAKAASPPRFPS